MYNPLKKLLTFIFLNAIIIFGKTENCHTWLEYIVIAVR